MMMIEWKENIPINDKVRKIRVNQFEIFINQPLIESILNSRKLLKMWLEEFSKIEFLSGILSATKQKKTRI